MFPISKRLVGAGISGALVLGLAVTAAARTGGSSGESAATSASSPTSSSTPVTTPSSSVPTTTLPPGVPPNAVGQAVPDGQTATHRAGAAGHVTIARSGNVLSIVRVTPNGGWTFEVEQSSGREIEVEFTGTGGRIDFEAELENGQVRVEVERDALDDQLADDHSGPGHGNDDDDHSGPGHGGDDHDDDDHDDDDDDRSGPGHDD